MTEPLTLLEPERTGFRPIHYLGCKLRVLDAIEAALDDVDASRGGVLDLFSGSGVVAAHLAQSRPVVATDIQEYARILASALLAGADLDATQSDEIVVAAKDHSASIIAGAVGALVRHEKAAIKAVAAGNPEPLCSVIEGGSILRSQLEGPPTAPGLAALLASAHTHIPEGVHTVLTRYYGGVYFSYEQAVMLDGLAAAARTIAAPQRDVALAAVMSAASDIVSSVGNQFAQPIRPRDASGHPKIASVRAAARRRSLDVTDLFLAALDRYGSRGATSTDGLAVRGDFSAILRDPPRDVSVVYADPPYTRDHYSRYYHVLETIALGDEPTVSRMRLGSDTLVSRGLYREERHQSPFCIKSQAPGAFAELFEGASDLRVPIVLSYSPHGDGSASRPRLMSIEAICSIANEWYAHIDVVSAGRLAHSKLNASHLNSNVVYDAEVLILCR